MKLFCAPKYMNTSRTEQLENFIAFHKLKYGRLIVFKAVVSFFKNDSLNKITSEVQVITLPHEQVMYINEFFKEEHQIAEMYSTAEFEFRYTTGNALEIWGSKTSAMPLLFIVPESEN